ncbi:MAG: protein-export chaperone SecB [Gammaproteobacteria bacterium]
MADEQQAAPQNEGEQKSIQLLKIYLKDVSFETPNSPAIFLKEWKPNLEFQVGNSAALTNDGQHEVVLALTVTVTVNGETAYLAEVHQAGIFSISGHEPDEVHRLHNVFCNRFLYPYACAALSDLVTKGGFPQLLLSPINFGLMYKKRLEEAQSAEAASTEH